MKTTEDIYRREILPKIVKDIPKSISKYRLNIEKEQDVVEDYWFIMDNVKSFKYLLIDEQYNRLFNYKVENKYLRIMRYKVFLPQGEELISELDSKSCSWSRFMWSIRDYRNYTDDEINTLIDLFLPSDRKLTFNVYIREMMKEDFVEELEEYEEYQGKFYSKKFPALIIHPFVSLKSFCFMSIVRNKKIRSGIERVYNMLWERMNEKERLSCYLYIKSHLVNVDDLNIKLNKFKSFYDVFIIDPKYLVTKSAKKASKLRSFSGLPYFTVSMFDVASFIFDL